MTETSRVLTRRPEKIFLLDQVVEYQGVLDAAITGDLYYWIAKGMKPWRRVEDYEELFLVNEKTIRSRMKGLFEDNEYFYRERSRMKKGYLGAYQFSAANSSNSKALVKIYESILTNSDIGKDFGGFDVYVNEYKEVPRFQILQVDAIQQTGDIKLAYVLCRIAWGQTSKGQSGLLFNSKAHLGTYLHMTPKTAFRLVQRLQKQGFIYVSEQPGQLKIGALDCDALSYIENYMAEKDEIRRAALMDAA